MKVDGNGQAKILNSEELQKLFAEGLTNPRDRLLFAICLFAGCRISEALALQVGDVKGGVLTFRKATTKGKLKTRAVDIGVQLAKFFQDYQQPSKGFLFPGGVPSEPLTRDSAHKVLKKACDHLGIEGVSTHSFRRTALTMMSSANVPLRIIQEISGHGDLGTLQRYLEVTPDQKRAAVFSIEF